MCVVYTLIYTLIVAIMFVMYIFEGDTQAIFDRLEAFKSGDNIGYDPT
jgi:hypothetical protein